MTRSRAKVNYAINNLAPRFPTSKTKVIGTLLTLMTGVGV